MPQNFPGVIFQYLRWLLQIAFLLLSFFHLYIYIYFLDGMEGFKLRASCLLGKCSTTWAMHPALFCFSLPQKAYHYFSSSWDYRHKPPCPDPPITFLSFLVILISCRFSQVLREDQVRPRNSRFLLPLCFSWVLRQCQRLFCSSSPSKEFTHIYQVILDTGDPKSPLAMSL
jgi:hypothetical protein